MPRALKDNVAYLVSRSRRAPGVALAALAIAVSVAGCGGGSSPSVANLGRSHGTRPNAGASPSGASASASGGAATSSGGGLSLHTVITAGNRKAGLKFAKCMRANGVSDFPDPNASGTFQFGTGTGSGIEPRSTQFQSAMQKCRKDLPSSHFTPAQLQAQKAAAIRFSQCMRSHGVANFPDPQFGANGRVSLKVGGPGSGLDPNSPIFQRAMTICGGRKVAGSGKVSATP